MNDNNVMQHIQSLADEEHRLLEHAGSGGLAGEDQQRLDQIQRQLDQCWDLLRQRRARRQAGLDPAEAEPRDAETVEKYVQ